jgi:photosystem I subunit PsaN
MAAMNSSVLACNYAISGTGSSELNAKIVSMPAVASPVVSGPKLPIIRAQQARADSKEMKASEGRRAALVYLAATLFTSAAAAASANAGVIEDYLEKSEANKVCFQICSSHNLIDSLKHQIIYFCCDVDCEGILL